MATREIKTTIALDGEQNFKNSVKQITKEFRVLNSEMKTISSQYDVTGDKATFLAEKQSLLSTKLAGQQNLTSGIRHMLKQMEDAYEDAGRRLDQLRNELTTATEAGNDDEIKRLTEEVRKAEIAFARAASNVQDYKIQLNGSITQENKIQAELNQTKKAIEATDREVEELGRDSVRAGRQLEDGIGEGAENAERSVKDLMQTMQQDLSSIKTSTAFTAVSGLWDMATGAYSSVAGFVESTAEYRRQLSFLEQNATTSGFDFGYIKEKLIEVQGLTGDASAAVEGLSNLLATDIDERQLQNAIENLAGAVISFPDTLKFESLADGLQETIATGSATGQFGELLERLGVDVEEFNTALEKSQTAAGDLDIAMGYLAANGMKSVYEQWQENNKAMNDGMQTQAELELELAEFGGTLEEYIVTPVKNLLVEALGWVNDTIGVAEGQGTGAAVEKIEADIQNAMNTVAEATKQAMDEVGEDIYNALPESAQKAVDATKPILKTLALPFEAAGDVSKVFTGKPEDFLSNTEAAALSIAEKGKKAAGDFIEVTIGDLLEGAALMAKDLSGGKIDLTEETRNMRKSQNATEEAKERFEQEAAAFEEAQKSWFDYNTKPALEEPVAFGGAEKNRLAFLDGVTQLETTQDAVDITDLLPISDLEAAGKEAGKGYIAGLAASFAGPEAIKQQKKMQALLEEAIAFEEAQKSWFDYNEGTDAFEAAGEEAGTAYINGLETVLDLSLFGEGKPAESYLKTNPVEAWEETIREEEQNLRDAGKEAGEALGEGLESGTESFTSMARMMGSNFGANLAAGMMSQHSYVYAASSALRAAAESAWGGGTSATSAQRTHHIGGSSNMINVALNIDGREFARAATPYIATQLTAP